MSDSVCEYCGSKSKDLVYHHKNAEKCIKKQIEKHGKPLYQISLKKIQNKPPRKPRTSKKDKAPSEETTPNNKKEKDDNDDDDEDIDIQLSDDSEDSHNDNENDSEQSDSDDINFSDNEEDSEDEPPSPPPIKVIVKKESPVKERNDIKKSFKHPELMKELPPQDNKEVESKLNLILNTLNSRDNKVIEEIKKLREELKEREDEAKQRHESLKKTITKVEKAISESNPVSLIEIIKKIQAEVESKSDLLQIFKEDLDETCDKYYELYKKLKDIKYDMEDMVYGKNKN